MASKPWQDISMDLIMPLPVSNGYDAILVVVDRFSKMMKALPCKSNMGAKELSTLFINRVLGEHRVPHSIISDRDPKFMFAFWTEFFAAFKTKLLPSTAYHP